MTDPDAVREPPEPPAKPPRPAAPQTSTTQSQLEADELYARQLAEHYSGGGPRGPPPQQQQWDGQGDRDHSFFDGKPLGIPSSR